MCSSLGGASSPTDVPTPPPETGGLVKHNSLVRLLKRTEGTKGSGYLLNRRLCVIQDGQVQLLTVGDLLGR